MRMIDRWFPCEAVSEASYAPYGSGKTEKSLFTWFAARPIAQARAAILTTLLPWPDEPTEQRRLQESVIGAVKGHPAALRDVANEIRRVYSNGVRILDPFSGRGIIPLEALRAGAEAWGLDYSPVATLGGQLLADFPFRDWSSEPNLPFAERHSRAVPLDALSSDSRLLHDLRVLLQEIGNRHEEAMDAFYPRNDRGERPWGYFWAQTMPCDECHNAFPLVGSAQLREPVPAIGDLGQCFSFAADRESGTLQALLHEGTTRADPTLLTATGKLGKIARCPFCGHPHALDVIKAKANAGLLRDRLLFVADLDPRVGPVFRLPTLAENVALEHAKQALAQEAEFPGGLSAIPNERIPPGNNDTIRASLYGVRTFGAMCCERQTLSFVRLCRVISSMQLELLSNGLSDEYARALLGYAGAVLVRKLRCSTRGATLYVKQKAVDSIFKNQASLIYNFDFFETGVGRGSGTWRSLMVHTLNAVEKLLPGVHAVPARIRQGSALHLPFSRGSVAAVITDPPYYEMIDYSDATDLFFVWLKRALGGTYPELFDTPGVQEKDEEIIVKRRGTPDDHRTREFYTRSLQQAFENVRTVLRDDGALTLVFGHGDPEAWRLLLSALMKARFVVTGSWPARTEAKSGAGAANIVVTITIACRTAPSQRDNGLQAEVDEEVRREIFDRVPSWDRDGLPLTDQLMAAYGPAMEVIGRYENVLRPDGAIVDIDYYLSHARRAVQDAAAIRVDGLPLETFDARTRFALFWTRLYVRQLAPKSEARFQAMASNLRLDDVRRDILEENTKGYRLAQFGELEPRNPDGGISPMSATINVVRQMVRAWRADGGDGVARILNLAERDHDDPALWAVIADLARILPAADADRKALDGITRNRVAIGQLRIVLERRRAADKPVQLTLVEREQDE